MAMQNLGEYRVVRLLGEGGMGKVFEAEERLSGRRVALKLLRPELSRSEPGRRLFENEMTILSKLDHPNVVRCLACTEVDGELMMALELLPGRTLRELIELEGPLEWPRAVGLVQQMARALGAAHEHEPPIVHRDLKPENVMVLDDGTAKVTDFGIAKLLAALGTVTSHSVGTLAYMSPEQIDAGPVDARSDLYALGLVFYELLAGRPPFESSSPRELLNLQCTAAPPPLPDSVRAGLPRGVERLLLELLEKPPDARPGSAADVLAELEPFAPSENAPAALSRPGSSRRKSAAGVKAQPTATIPAPPHDGEDSAHITQRSTPAPSRQPAASAPEPSRTPARGTPAATRTPTKREDTIALLERASLPREISARKALLVVVALSALSGLATYALRAAGSPAEKPAVASRAAP
jgi:eukaryotic-like serine/threonine-protein kinase